jgi:Xaa-Pro aminopeptidase
MARVCIPNSEFAARVARVQDEVQARGLDALLAHSDEADLANVRYLSNYWPIFETAGVIVPARGEAIQIIGPESETYARDMSRLPTVRKVLEYRESAEPEYPELKLDTFASIFAELGIAPRRIGIAGMSILPVTIYEALRRDCPGAEIVKADDILSDMRTIKSPAELDCMREAFRISEIGLEAVLAEIRPGMTELQAVGIAQRAMYEAGAEYEGHPQYVLSGINTTHAIGRPGHRVLERGDYVQLDIGARVDGYSSSVGRPLCLGKMTPEMRRLTEVGLEAHYLTQDWMQVGVVAKEVVAKFMRFVRDQGCGDNLLYGPCHGIGLIEVERPWMESNSEYPLAGNMTFQVDTFLCAAEFGLRWENGARVAEGGVERFSDIRMEIIELDV